MFVSYDLVNFGNELREIRRSLGFSQRYVQQTMGINVDTLRKIEGGQVIPRYETLELLSVAYKQDLLDLLKNCRVNRFLMEFYDDLDYIITCYDRNAADQLKNALRDSFPQPHLSSLVNLNELKQFTTFVEAISAYFSGFSADRDYSLKKLTAAMRLTLPGFTIEDYGKFTYSYFEYRILLLISLFIAETEDFVLSNEILYYILERLSNSTYSTKYKDFLIINIHLNIAYNYHMLDEHAQVIEATEAGIAYCIKRKTHHALFSLYYRKGIAQLNLDSEAYLDSIATAFYLLKATGNYTLLNHYSQITEEKYGVCIPFAE